MNSDCPQPIQKEMAALAGKSDEDIDFSDIPVTTERDWEGAVRGKFYHPVKSQPSEAAAQSDDTP